jgi:hypothetical protein
MNSTESGTLSASSSGSGSSLSSSLLSDPASTLRAAALLTLKSKRRKPTVDRPAMDDNAPTLQLDYGQQEVVPIEMDIREEGEISDTEGSAAPTPGIKGKFFVSLMVVTNNTMM